MAKAVLSVTYQKRINIDFIMSHLIRILCKSVRGLPERVMRKCLFAPRRACKKKNGSHPVAARRYKWDEDFIYLEMAFSH